MTYGGGIVSCDALVLLGALVSIQLAQGLTTEQIELLSAFFEVLGDNLALLALRSGGGGCPPEDE